MELKKYIIIGGCSYSHQSIDTIRNIVGEPNIEFIQIGTPSSSNKFISDSIIFLVDELLKNSVLPENILIVNNFTQIGRYNPILPPNIQKEVENNLDITQEFRYFNFTYSFYNSFAKIKSRMYYLMIGSRKISSSVSNWIKSKEDYVMKKGNITYFFENYLINIILLQNYYKRKGVSCISYMMSNVFEGWDDDFSHIYSKNKEWKLPSLKNLKHISELSDITNILWELVDLNDICFYSTKNNKYGGIDEYFIDKFSDIKYLQDKPQSDYMFYGNHPNHEVYHQFTNELMKDKILEWKHKSIL